MDAFLDMTHQIHEVETTTLSTPSSSSNSNSSPIDNKNLSAEELAHKLRTEDDFRTFYHNGYKILLTVGLLCTDNHHKVQTRIADRKGMQLLISYAFCSDRFEERFGVRTVIDILKQHPTAVEINRQGMALLLVMLANDSYCKYSITQARQMAMANSIVEVVHAAQREFKQFGDIVTSSKGVLNVIIKDWS
eukprot:gene21998-28088_t